MPAVAAIYWFDMDTVSFREDAALAFLDPGERLHLRTLSNDRVAKRFLCRRVARRLILANHARAHPEEIVFADSGTGKSELVGDLGHLVFSPSSSGSLGIVAVREGGPIGADVEVDRPVRSDLLARSALSPAEARAFAALSPRARKSWFLSRWTVKEAVIKTLGTGIEVHALSDIDTSDVMQDKPPTMIGLSGSYAGSGRIYAASLAPMIPGQHGVSIALAATVPTEMKLYDATGLIRRALDDCHGN